LFTNNYSVSESSSSVSVVRDSTAKKQPVSGLESHFSSIFRASVFGTLRWTTSIHDPPSIPRPRGRHARARTPPGPHPKGPVESRLELTAELSVGIYSMFSFRPTTEFCFDEIFPKEIFKQNFRWVNWFIIFIQKPFGLFFDAFTKLHANSSNYGGYFQNSLQTNYSN